MSSFRRFLSRPFGWLIAVAVFLGLAVPLAWATLAIYYSNLPWAGARMALAAVFAAWEPPTRPAVAPAMTPSSKHAMVRGLIRGSFVECHAFAIRRSSTA